MSTELWAITDHCCRACGGRVLAEHGGPAHRCASCGWRAIGPASAICACGHRREGQRRGSKSGFSCGPNPARGNESPDEIVMLFGGEPIECGARA